MLKIVFSILVLLISNSVLANCYIIGDSIAQGVAHHIKNCESATQVGLNTNNALIYWGMNSYLEKELNKELIVVSLGVNDGNGNTLENLVKIRTNMHANKIIWILPTKENKKNIVKRIAYYYNDYILDIDSVIGKDGIHPTGNGYQYIADRIKNFK